jgi:hypothetical protein
MWNRALTVSMRDILVQSRNTAVRILVDIQKHLLAFQILFLIVLTYLWTDTRKVLCHLNNITCILIINSANPIFGVRNLEKFPVVAR